MTSMLTANHATMTVKTVRRYGGNGYRLVTGSDAVGRGAKGSDMINRGTERSGTTATGRGK